MPKGKIAGFFAEAIQVIHLLAFINHCGGRDFHLAFSLEQYMNRLLPFFLTVTQRKQYESLKGSFPYPIAYPIFYRARLFGGIGYNTFTFSRIGFFNSLMIKVNYTAQKKVTPQLSKFANEKARRNFNGECIGK